MGRHAYIGLTPRQIEVVRLVAQGWKNPEIAYLMEITPETVCSHMKQLKRRAGVRTRAQLRALAGEYSVESGVSDGN